MTRSAVGDDSGFLTRQSRFELHQASVFVIESLRDRHIDALALVASLRLGKRFLDQPDSSRRMTRDLLCGPL